MSELLYVGIDPGRHGYIVGINATGQVKIQEKIPYNDKDIDLRETYEIIASLAPAARAVLERQQTFPGDSPNRAFRLACGYASLESFLVACMIPYDLVLPRVWKKSLGISLFSRREETKSQKKTRLKKLATEKAAALFPGFNLIPPGKRTKNHDLAEALLLAEMARRTFREK